jgi:ribosomal protein S1
MKDLSDEFVKDPHVMFPVGKLVTARLLSVSQTEGSAKLSLKASVVLGDKLGDEEIQNLKVKQTIEGTVQTVAAIGVFIAIKGTSLVGIHIYIHTHIYI